MKCYGQTLREIRKSKKMSLGKLSENIISTSFLSKFERCESDMSFSTMVALLDRMNVPVEHFLIIHHDFHRTNYQELFQQIADCYTNADVQRLHQIYEQQGLFQHEGARLNRIVLQCLIKRLQNGAVEQSELQPLIDYLWRVERWGEYEVLLFTYSLNDMNLQSVKVLMNDLTLKNQFFQLKINYRHNYYNVLIYTLDRFIEERAYEEARALYAQYMQVINIPTHFIYEQLLFHYYKMIIDWGCGDKSVARQIDELLQTLQNINISINITGKLQQQWQRLQHKK